MKLARRCRCSLASLALLCAVACGSEETAGVQPLPPTPPQRAPVAEPPPPAIVQPHLRRAASSGTSAPVRSLHAGGGAVYEPPPDRPPSPREVEEFRRRFERELDEQVDPREDPCDQLADVGRATIAAAGGDPRDLPTKQIRQPCRDFPPTLQQCMTQEYFREHAEQCQAELQRMGERGQRRLDRAQRDWERAVQTGHPAGERPRPRSEPAEDG